jgi:hypothetical protein
MDDSSESVQSESEIPQTVDNPDVEPLATLQNRLEVLWRTLHKDKIYDYHPLPDRFGKEHEIRMQLYLDG